MLTFKIVVIGILAVMKFLYEYSVSYRDTLNQLQGRSGSRSGED